MLANLTERFAQTRSATESLCKPLAIEDLVVQSMPDASPARWHLAHTTWFFETFVLAHWDADYGAVNADYQLLFNSYYNSVGEPFPRSRRGLLTRPTVAEVFRYRQVVDDRMLRLLHALEGAAAAQAAPVVELGIHHEQQHQELLLTDLKHLFSCNPLWPAYCSAPEEPIATIHKSKAWSIHSGGLVQIGHEGRAFAFDNERPRHRVFLEPFEIQRRLVTNREYLEFMNDDGYLRPELWLSLGWSTLRENDWIAPLYWVRKEEQWWQFSLDGLRPLNTDEPVCHVSYFEADAFARWSGARLPTEAEWEHAAAHVNPQDSLKVDQNFHPRSVYDQSDDMAQLYGEVWQWTASPYTPYPGYLAPRGALGEYNGKFMCNQQVLRGGSCVTPVDHMRTTYRNFFSPDARWQFSGIRLARDAMK